ncbi:DUF3800 domain-containing protein [Salinarimonas sp.]|uniref:DUF3800 domain-containing protein n=1 Tax=Salinarimonas sp. TaxID=2766526 RepID=UPI0032D96866
MNDDDVTHIYCDESCHLERDHQRSMVLGAITCPAATRRAVGREIKRLRAEHGIPAEREIKWTQVSPAKVGFYLSLVDLFFDRTDLGFRAVVVPDKEKLDHQRFGQSHDEFYYKMWWQLLTRLIDDEHRFRVFIDIKDTRGATKLRRLHEVLTHTHYDFDRARILSVESVHSQDVPVMQLADLMIGAISHVHRGLRESEAKLQVIDRIKRSSRLSLISSTPPSARKVNVFVWRPQR